MDGLKQKKCGKEGEKFCHVEKVEVLKVAIQPEFVIYSMKRFLLSLLILTGCMYPPKQFKDKSLVIANNQTVHIEELGLSVTNHGCGREWVSENGNPDYERVFCNVDVKTKDSTYRFSHADKTLFIKNIKLEIDQMNPWGREQDSIPAGGCRIIVTKLPDTSR
jgi:hypothetical protein